MVRRRFRHAWVWINDTAEKEYPGYYARMKRDGGQCPMESSTGKRCVKTFLHRRGHSSQERHRGQAF